MLKKLAILALAIGLSCEAWSQVPRYGSQQKQPAQSNNGNAAPTAQPCVCTVQIENASAKEAEKSEKKPSQYPWRELYAPANVPNWVLALVAGWAGVMALKTLRAIRKQVDVQAAAMTQWVDVECDPPRNGEFRDALGFPLESIPIELCFRAVNNTPFVLDIQRIVTNISRKHINGKPRWEPFEIRPQQRLPPGKREKPSEYRFVVPFRMDGTLVSRGGHFVVSVAGTVYYKDCLERDQQEHFGGLYALFEDKIRELPMISQAQEIPDNANQNQE